METATQNQNIDVDLEAAYLNSLTEKERKAYEVAKNHLGSLWNVYKCNGFLQWQKKQKAI